MAFTNPNRWKALVPVVLAAQVLWVHAAAGNEHSPEPPAPSRFPAEIGPWKVARQDPIAIDVAAELGADRLFSQTYMELPTGSLASLLVAWFQTQLGGARQPHSPKVCLPASGWTSAVSDDVTLTTTAGTIRVSRLLVVNGTRRAIVLYWYQTPWHVMGDEWTAKLWLVADSLRYKRTDTALVRVIAWPAGITDDEATAAATRFASRLYPKLREYLPR